MIKFKTTPIVYVDKHSGIGLVEGEIYIYQGETPMSGGDAEYQWICEESDITSRFDQLIGAPYLPQ